MEAVTLRLTDFFKDAFVLSQRSYFYTKPVLCINCSVSVIIILIKNLSACSEPVRPSTTFKHGNTPS